MLKEHVLIVRSHDGQEVSRSETEQTLYTLAELEDQHPAAWQKAYDRWREGNLGYEWWDGVYDTAIAAAEILGITIEKRRGSNVEPAIWFSGFASQGDGACWEGSYRYSRGAHEHIRKEFPQAEALHRIADELLSVQRRNGYGVTATSDHRGHYYHSGCMSVFVDSERTRLSEVAEDAIKEALRDFADWIYRTLEEEADYLQSEEQFRESCGDDLFNENGNRV